MSNPLLAPSTLPFELPPFVDLGAPQYREAILQGIREHRAEAEAIATNAEAPTLDNTVVALERSGELLDRALRAFQPVVSAHGTPELRDLDTELSPLLSEHTDALTLDARLHARVRAVAEDEAAVAALDPESRRLVERTLLEMDLAGASLDAAAQEQLGALNGQIASAQADFRNTLLAATNAGALHVLDRTRLAGLDEGRITGLADAAAERGLDGYLIALVNTTGHPLLAALEDSELRRELHAAQMTKGETGDEHDTRLIAARIARLRAERAAVLGHPDHASAALVDRMAHDPQTVAEFLGRLAGPAARNVAREQAELEAETGAPVAAHDWARAAERVRATAFDLDLGALKPWFEAGRVLRDGIFYAATRLYGLTFHERPDLRGWHSDMEVFEVREEDGTPIGLYLLDLYARDTKKGGAWMNSPVARSELRGRDHAVVTNNLNVPKPPAGQPTLLTFTEVTTFFHESGHALHGLLARVRYPRFAGTSVPRDYVEYPSQVNEMWILWPEILANYARHHETGDPLPEDVVDKLTAATEHGEGFTTSAYLGAALLDQAWHTIGADEVPGDLASIEAFESAALARAGLDNPAVPPRYRTAYFSHTFGLGYDAQYYAYIWSEVLDADTVAWFEENGGLSRENGDRYRRHIIGVGGSVDPAEAYRGFRGRDPELKHLLARRGLDS